MTHAREPLTTEGVGFEAIGELSDTELRKATGKTRAYFYRIFNPTIAEYLQFEDAAAIDAALLAKGMAPRFKPLFKALFKALRDESLEGLGGRREHTIEDVDRRILAAVAVVGDLCRIVPEMKRCPDTGRLVPTIEHARRLAEFARQLAELAPLIAEDTRAAMNAGRAKVPGGVVA